MEPAVVVTSYGRDASQHLADTIIELKQGAALAPVTVVVPSNFAGLTARRMLASGMLGIGGVANVNFFTPFRLAELLAVGRLGSKRPLTNPVLGAAVRRVLADDPRHFRNVREHQATEQALASAVGELANVSKRGLQAIRDQGGAAGAIVDMYHDITSHLGGFHDEADVARAAAHRPDLAQIAAPYGHVIWYLPGVVSAPLGGFLQSLFAAVPASVIVASGGSAAVDNQVRRSMRLAGLFRSMSHTSPSLAEGTLALDFGTEASSEHHADTAAQPDFDRAHIAEPLADHVISVTDADEEVRAVIREVIQLVDQGVRLDRIGIFHPVPDPYVRILEQQFAAAGIVANGPSRRRLSESIAGRTLTAALALSAERWRRDRVVALVSGGPVRFGDGPARPTVWDAVSRQAGVVGGLADWRAKLARHRSVLEQWRDESAQAGRNDRAERRGQEAADTADLASFVDQLADLVAAVERASGWSDRSAAATDLLHNLLGPAHTHHRWPDQEQADFESVEAALERLALLDEIEPDPSLAVFVRALSAELSVARRRTGRFGHGLVYGPLASAPGQDLDAVFVLGCTEGLCPAPRRQDVLLPDSARQLTGGDLVERLGQIHEQHRLFLAALAAAPVGRRWLFLPRGDLRSSRRSRPSRWLLPTASKLAGETLYGTSFEHDSPPGVHEVPSHAQALVQATHFASIQERDVAQVYAYTLSGGEAVGHPAAQLVERGLEMQAARNSSQFTEFDGNLTSGRGAGTDERPLSASRLENWAKCGLRYFLGYELGLSERDDPERTVELSALDRGSAMHSILEQFMLEMIQAGPPAPHEPWNVQQRTRASEIASNVFDDYEKRGRTGRHIVWATQKSDLLAVVDEFLTADDHHRRTTNSTPKLLEMPFGLEDTPPLALEIDADRVLRFRGFIDRVDTTETGGAFVSDYKTGSGSAYDDLDERDPTMQGRLLQLGLYAEAVAQRLDTAEIDTHYWMVSGRGQYKRIGYPWTPDYHDRLVQVLGAISTGIESGVFPMVPGEWQSWRGRYSECAFCEFDSICPGARSEQASDKDDAPELAVRLALTAPPERSA